MLLVAAASPPVVFLFVAWPYRATRRAAIGGAIPPLFVHELATLARTKQKLCAVDIVVNARNDIQQQQKEHNNKSRRWLFVCSPSQPARHTESNPRNRFVTSADDALLSHQPVSSFLPHLAALPREKTTLSQLRNVVPTYINI